MKTTLLLVILFWFKISLTQETKYVPVEEVNGLNVGDTVNFFSAKNQHDSIISLQALLEQGPVVVVFYRGQWCPVCNRHIGALADSLNLIQAQGATVIAVSPEKQEYLQETEEKTGAKFNLLHDKDYLICNSFDVLFTPTKKQKVTYNGVLGAKLKTAQSDDSQRLPVPATFLINQKGVIVWRQFDRDFHHRSTVKEILKQLETL